MSDAGDFPILVPKVDWNGRAADMRSRLATWEWRWKLPKGKQTVTIDFSRVSFMEPWAMSMFAAYGLQMRRSGVTVRACFDAANPANQYMTGMGLQAVLESGSAVDVTRHWQESNQNTGLHVIQTYADLKSFKASADRLALEHCPNAADSLRYAMDEIGRNVIQHSASQIGGVAIAQHFPVDGRLQVSVCDHGRGILAHLRGSNPELQTDIESLRLAILPHASGASPSGPYGGAENSGLGLFCSTQLAVRARGSLWIASGRGLLGVRGDVASSPTDLPTKVYRKIEPWPGTVVAMDFPTAAAQSLPDVLKECSRIAAEARRMAGPAGLDFLGTEVDMESAYTVHVRAFDGDNVEAGRERAEILPRLQRGEPVVIDFQDVRAPAQSFVHALLAEAFSVPGSLVRISFANCAPSAKAVLDLVAAYASYRRVVEG